MPIEWTILHAERRVLARTEGKVGLRDIEAYLDDVVVKGAAAYGKLFDAREGSVSGSDDDLMMLAARIRAYASTMPGGPLAIVATNAEARAFADRYVNLAQADRPVAVFRTVDEARSWLDNHR